jgi:hypothetical protein
MVSQLSRALKIGRTGQGLIIIGSLASYLFYRSSDNTLASRRTHFGISPVAIETITNIDAKP